MKKWYEAARRWGQTNLTEIDPEICDIDFWKEFWKKTDTQAIIVNAGGIVAYYPSRFEHHYRAAKLGNRDFFGEFAAAGREAGLAVLARMDINRATREFYDAHPDWFSRQKDGSPYIVQGRYKSCLNSAYYKEYIPEVLKEIINLYHPDGFTDNSWTGLKRNEICYCDNCKREFKKYNNSDLPENADYKDPVYRQWMRWSHKCRMDNWDLYNQITQKFGGEDCLWLGMVNASIVGSKASFCDLREVAKRSKIIMVDHQSREGHGFEQNSLNGVLLHQLVGWDTIIPESMGAYARGPLSFRRSATSSLELNLWMLEGFAGGISPWWHIVGGVQEDQRIYDIEIPLMQWHQKHEQYLYNRLPVANVGVLWSQSNTDFFGADQAYGRVEMSWRGINMALTRAGIPFLPVNADDINEQTKDMDVLILPEMAILTPEQATAIKSFAKRGGNILAIGSVGIMEDDGSLRTSSTLEDVLGIRFKSTEINDPRDDAGWENPVLHNYCRIEQRQHPIFNGFEKTSILPMGGVVKDISLAPGAVALGSFIPAFPIFPPEFAWTDVTHTDIPVLSEFIHEGGGKSIYIAWDLDSAYGKAANPDHGDLLGNCITYLLSGRERASVKSDGYIDFKMYRQEQRVIIHLINLNYTGFDQGYAEKNIPVGPVQISLHIPNFSPSSVTATEDAQQPKLSVSEGTVKVELNCLKIHQLLIIE